MASRKNAASPIDLRRPVVEALEYFGPEMTRLHLELIRRIEMIRESAGGETTSASLAQALAALIERIGANPGSER